MAAGPKRVAGVLPDDDRAQAQLFANTVAMAYNGIPRRQSCMFLGFGV